MDASPFVERREGGRYWLVARGWAADLEALGWPAREAVARAFAAPASTGRTSTAVLAVPGRTARIHLRPVRHGGLLGPLWRDLVWGTGRPADELRVTARLAAAGAPVPEPVLVAAFRRAGPLWSAVVGTRHEEEARDALAWLSGASDREAILRGARAAGRAIRRFHDAGGTHADLHVKNLLVREGAGRTEVQVIDLDRARAGAAPDADRRLRELMRLYRSLVKRGLAARVGDRGCAAAFAAYCGGDRALRRAMLARLPTEQRRVARHAIAYRRSA